MRPCFFILCILRAVSVIVAQSHWLHLMAGGILEGGERRFTRKKGLPSVSKVSQVFPRSTKIQKRRFNHTYQRLLSEKPDKKQRG